MNLPHLFSAFRQRLFRQLIAVSTIVSLMGSHPGGAIAQDDPVKAASQQTAIADDSGTETGADQVDSVKKNSEATAETKPAEQKKPEKTGWIALRDSWKPCEFGGDGEIEIEKGVITLGYGSPITGVKWVGPVGGDKGLPRDNFELELEAKRVDGFDFLCALTFPVAKSHASLVLGGWGGGVTGISSIDGYDASDNQTTTFESYENGKWYRARIHVDQEQIIVWINDEKMFDHPRKGYDFDIRFEMDSCTPFGLANYECKSQIRNIRIRPLKPSEITKPDESDIRAVEKTDD